MSRRVLFVAEAVTLAHVARAAALAVELHKVMTHPGAAEHLDWLYVAS
jgi:hypothetical protein